MAWRNWNGDNIVNQFESNLKNSINKTLETIFTESKGEVPLDEGVLSGSGRVVMAKKGGSVSFGGGSGTGHPLVPYAIRWHENPANFQHGRKRFYLRDPFNRLAINELMNNLRRL